jgi:hypothetical protein
VRLDQKLERTDGCETRDVKALEFANHSINFRVFVLIREFVVFSLDFMMKSIEISFNLSADRESCKLRKLLIVLSFQLVAVRLAKMVDHVKKKVLSFILFRKRDAQFFELGLSIALFLSNFLDDGGEMVLDVRKQELGQFLSESATPKQLRRKG